MSTLPHAVTLPGRREPTRSRGGRVVPLRPRQTSATLPQEIAAQRLVAVIGDAEDWADPEAVSAALQSGTLGICLRGTSHFDVRLVPSLERVGPGPHRPLRGHPLPQAGEGVMSHSGHPARPKPFVPFASITQ